MDTELNTVESKWRQQLLAASRPHQLPRYNAFKQILEHFGFRLVMVNRLHNIFMHSETKAFLNLQNIDGGIKPFQVRQVIHLIYKYALKASDE